jgi:RimJ/RimL family protein N-acetyltransferase
MTARVEPTTDIGLISEAMTHPRVYPYIKDDSCPARGDFRPHIGAPFVYLAAFDDDEFLGVFVLHPHNEILWEVHTCLMPNGWGPAALEATAAGMRWIWANTACIRIMTVVPEGNLLAMRLAQKSGMTEFGFNPKCFRVNGKAVGLHMLGISKE